MNIRILAVLACLFAPLAHAQTSVDVPVDNARVIARQALLSGNVELAVQIARALLARDPDDRAALVVLAAAAPRLDDPSEGRRAGVRAWAVSQTDAQKYEAARLTALAAAAEERFTLSTFWLRRALTVVPNDAERTRTIRDARRVTQLNPWSTNLSFSIVPSNNVNGGSEDEELSAPGQPPLTLSADALALPGVRATLNFSTRYRLLATPRSRTTVGLQYQSSRVRLNDDTVEDPINPGTTVTLDAGEFATDLTQLTLGHDRALQNGTMNALLTVGTFEFGGEPYYDFARILLARGVPLSDNLSLNLSAQRQKQAYESIGIRDVYQTTLRTGLSYRLASGDRISGTLGYVDSKGFSVNNTYEEWLIQGSYRWAEPIGPVSLSVNVGLKSTDYPDYSVLGPVDGGREDESFLYGINIGFPDVEYAGFSPALVINGSVAESNISRFTRDTFSVGFVLNSAF